MSDSFKEAVEQLKEQREELHLAQEYIGGVLQKNETLMNKLQSVFENQAYLTNKKKNGEVYVTIKYLINMLKPETKPELLKNIASVLAEFDKEDSEICADIIFQRSCNDPWFLYEAVGVKLCVYTSWQDSSEVYKQLLELLQNNFYEVFNQPKTGGTVHGYDKTLEITIVTLLGQLFNISRRTIPFFLNPFFSTLIKVKSQLSIKCMFELMVIISAGRGSNYFKFTDENLKDLESLQNDSYLHEDEKLLVTRSLALYQQACLCF